MANLEECRDLMHRILELPNNNEKLKKMGFSDEDIDTYRELLTLFDPKSNAKIIRMIELINYKPQH